MARGRVRLVWGRSLSELLLGVDIGTASSKAVLVTPSGEVVARSVCKHAVTLPHPGWVEHDAESVWWADFRALCAELVPVARDGIAAVGISGIGPCVVPCTAADEPLRPAILYGVDTRAMAEAEELTQLFGEGTVRARCGSSLTSQALGPKLMWLKRHEPQVWQLMRRWHMASSFLVARLTGEWVLDHHSASQCDPFYDLERCCWAKDWLELVLPDLNLPRLAWAGEVVGTVTGRASATTGLRKGTPVVAGTIDAWAEAVSVDVRQVGDLMLMYGSTMFLVAVSDRWSPEKTMWTTRATSPGSLTLAAGLATSGSLLDWFRGIIGDVGYDEIVDEAMSTPPGSSGLLVLPYFAGERTPIFDPKARGAILGLTLAHTRGHVFRALIEGIAYGVRHNLEALTGLAISRIRAVGGGTGNDLWLQAVSDVCGVSQGVPEETVGASFGDARLAGEGIGLVDESASWMRLKTTVEPNQELHDLYSELYGHYRQLYPVTRDIAHALADIQVRFGNRQGSLSAEGAQVTT